jgi:hypothetical protein
VQVRSRSGHASARVDGEALDPPTQLEFPIHHRGLRMLVPPDSVVNAERRRARNIEAGALWRLVRGKPPGDPGGGGTRGVLAEPTTRRSSVPTCDTLRVADAG